MGSPALTPAWMSRQPAATTELPTVSAVMSSDSRMGTPERSSTPRVRVNRASAVLCTRLPNTGAFSFILSHRPARRVRARGIPFESGVSQGSPKAQRFSVNFYLTAMLFILFDIEIVFLYPLAVILHELAWFGFFEFLTFLVVLLVAYVYIWRKGALEWR